jgi:hypothetical protein
MGESRFVHLVLLVLVIYSSTGRAQDTPQLKLSTHDLTVLGLTIGESSRAQVESRLGKTQEFKIGRREEADEAVCYRSNSQDDDTVVVFYFGTIGGWTDVTRIAILKARMLPWPSSRCSSNSAISRDLEFLRGLKLGTRATDMVRILGPATRVAKNRWYYYVSHNCESPKAPAGEKKPAADSPCVDVDSVDAKFAPEEGLIFLSFYHFQDK